MRVALGADHAGVDLKAQVHGWLITGARAGLCHDTYSAHQGVEHDDMKRAGGARVIGPALAQELVRAYVGAEFSGEERHRRRLAKVRHLEERT